MPTTANEKDLLVEVRWIRPTKLCAIFDLFLAILAYIIALVAGKWVFDFKDESYHVSLYNQCYNIEKAKALIDIACSAHLINSARGDSKLLEASSSSRIGPECEKSSQFSARISDLNEDESSFDCIKISEKLPWTTSPMEHTGHHFWTVILLVIPLVGCILCWIIAVFVFIRGSKGAHEGDTKQADRNTSIFKIIGLTLFLLGILALSAVIVFGVGFPAAVPYPSEWKFTWGFGFAFAACILTFIAGILFFFGTTWKRNVYSKKRTFQLW